MFTEPVKESIAACAKHLGHFLDGLRIDGFAHGIVEMRFGFQLETQKQENIELKPKAHFHDAVCEAVNAQTIEEVAKVLGTGRNRLFHWLREHHLLMHNN